MYSNEHNENVQSGFLFCISAIGIYLLYREIKAWIPFIILAVALIWIALSIDNALHRKSMTKMKARLKQEEKVEYKAVSQLENAVKMQIDSVTDQYIHLTKDAQGSGKWYTNTEFTRHILEFLPLYDKLAKVMDHFEKAHNHRFTKGISSDSILRTVLNHKKGFDGEELVKETLAKDRVKFLESVNLKDDEMQVEIDFMIVSGNNIVTLEVKDFSSDEIVLDSSGELYKVVNGKKEVIEGVLSQINRHKRFIRENFPADVNVVNLIVLSDKKTTVINNMNSDKLKIVVPDYVVNIIEDLNGQDKEREEEILGKVRKLSAPERKFEFFDIEKEIQTMKTLLEGEDSLLEKYRKFYSLNPSDLEKMLINNYITFMKEIDENHEEDESGFFTRHKHYCGSFIKKHQTIKEQMDAI